ncbi:MAG TPA: CHAT domain-containing protein, partial [Nannocystaceae bacterium]|nr:CHAT domain-containing protein [Nannocystaceae bacterium]
VVVGRHRIRDERFIARRRGRLSAIGRLRFVLRRAARVLTVGMMLACGSKPREAEPLPSEPLPIVPTAELVVEHAGCTVSTRTPATCTLRGSERALRLWIDAIEAPVVEVDGIAAAERPVRVGTELEGWRATVAIPAGAHELRVRTATGAWTMELRDAPPTPVLDAIEAKLPKETDPDRSAALVKVLAELTQALPNTEGLERVALLRLASILSWDLGRMDDAIAYSRKAIDAAIESELASVAIDVAQSLATFVADVPGETSWLAELQRVYMREYGDGRRRVRWQYAVAYEAFDAGELGAALAEIESSRRLAADLGLGDDELAAAALEVSLYALLGRTEDQRRMTTRILELADARASNNACQDAIALSGMAWSLLQASATRSTDDDPERVLARALAYYGPSGECGVGSNHDWSLAEQYARVYHAIAALMRNDLGALRTRLAWLDGRSVAPELRGWISYLSAEIAFSDHDAARALEHLGSVGPDAGDPTIIWRATVLRGRVLEQLGRRQDALAAYLQSEKLLDELVEHVAIDQGREGIGLGMHSGATGAIALLLAENRLEEATRIARLSRTRALRPVGRAALVSQLSPAARSRYQVELSRYRELSARIAAELTEMWKLPADERAAILRSHAGLREDMRASMARAYALLSAEHRENRELARPGPREVWLLYHPSESGWFGFAFSQQEIIAKEIGPAPDATDKTAIAQWLRTPFDSTLQDESEVHVLAMGSLVDLPFETLPRASGTLLSERPVAYGLDKLITEDVSPRDTALVVGDPGNADGAGELPRAREEATVVSAELERRGYRVSLLLGDTATHSAVAKMLGDVDWFHHAGHGTFQGTSGWDSSLPLTGEAQLSVRDVLALPRAPRAVVLSACDTATTGTNTAAGAMHLARAFLLAGSRFVIASHSDVEDDVASRFATVLYTRSSDLRVASGAQLLRATAIALDATATAEALPFHAWVP